MLLSGRCVHNAPMRSQSPCLPKSTIKRMVRVKNFLRALPLNELVTRLCESVTRQPLPATQCSIADSCTCRRVGMAMGHYCCRQSDFDSSLYDRFDRVRARTRRSKRHGSSRRRRLLAACLCLTPVFGHLSHHTVFGAPEKFTGVVFLCRLITLPADNDLSWIECGLECSRGLYSMIELREKNTADESSF